MTRVLCGVCILPLLWISCSDDHSDESLPDQWQAFIVCEGNFGSANGEITLLDTVESDTTLRRAYSIANGQKLGDSPHAIWSVGSTLCVAVTHSDRIAILNPQTMKVTGTIETVHSPRNGTTDGAVAYVTEYSDSSVVAIDISAKMITRRWKLTHKPDEILWMGGSLFVSSAPGQNDTIISVIDLSTNAIQTTTIGMNPISLTGIARLNEVYVASAGNASTAGFIAVVDAATLSIKSKLGEMDNIRPVRVVAQDPAVAYIMNENGDLALRNVDTGNELKTDGRNYYGLGWGNGEVFALDAIDFVGHGEVHWLADDLSIRKVFSTDVAPVSILFFP